MHRLSILQVLAVTHQGLLGQIVASFLNSKHCALFPFLSLLLFLFYLLLQLPCVSDGTSDLLFRLPKLTPHVIDRLIENLLRILGAGNQVIDVRLQQRRNALEDSHSSVIPPYQDQALASTCTKKSGLIRNVLNSSLNNTQQLRRWWRPGQAFALPYGSEKPLCELNPFSEFHHFVA